MERKGNGFYRKYIRVRVVKNIFESASLKNILITCVSIAVIFPLFSLFFVIPSFTKLLTDNTVNEAIRTGKHLTRILESRHDVLSKGTISDSIIKMIGKVRKDFQLEKVRIFSKTGKILFSTEPREIGRTNTREYFRDIVAAGRVYFQTVRKNSMSVEGNVLKVDVVEIYIPIMEKGSFLGAFEIYYDVTQRKSRLDAILSLSNYILIFIATSLLFLVLFVLLKASHTDLERTQMEDKLRKSQDELEKRIKERTSALLTLNKQLQAEVKEREVAENELKRSEAMYKNLFDNAQVGLFRTRIEDGKVLEANDLCAKIFGYEHGEFIRQWYASKEYVNPDDRIQMMNELKKNGFIKNFKTRFRKKDGSIIWVRYSIQIFPNQGFLEGVMIDITEQKHAQEIRNKLENMLRQSQKMEAVGTLAGGIAHDFNNILGGIMGYAELVRINSPVNKKTGQYVEHILSACNRAKKLIMQILAFSRQSKSEKTPCYIDVVVKEALKLLRASLPSTIDIRKNIEADSIAIMADQTQIHQVIMNLCANAFLSMEKQGGILEVSVIYVEFHSELETAYYDLKPGCYLQLSVTDTGCGMDSETISRIFEPYFTTRETGEGTGMGLATVHGIVKDHGGSINVYSEPGTGSSFHLFFPVTKYDIDSMPVETESLPVGNERILFIDDEEFLIEIGESMLNYLGYKVESTTLPDYALKKFSKDPARYDLVISDITMPKMTGKKLAEKIHEIRPDIPVILCTGFNRDITPEKKILGIRSILLKPFTLKNLAVTVREVLDAEVKN